MRAAGTKGWRGGRLAGFLALAVLVGAALVFSGGAGRKRQARANTPFAGRPAIMLWSWQRAQAFPFLNPRVAGVAFLAKTIWLTGDDIRVVPNLDGLSVPVGTWMMACARIQVDTLRTPALGKRQADAAAGAIAALSQLPRVQAVQVDFDATRSEQPFYRQMLVSLRRRLPRYPISMTALASWCLGDDWLRGLPVNEAVPMLYRMGAARELRRQLRAGLRFRAPLCLQSVGLSTSAPQLRRPVEQYWFDPNGWTRQAYREVTKRWQAVGSER